MSAPDWLSEIKARLALAAMAELATHAPGDLAWAVEEIDYLRCYNDALSSLAGEQDGLIWALGGPGLRDVAHQQGQVETAQAALGEIPLGRPGKCQMGSRRRATHDLVIERGDVVQRHARCDAGGELGLRSRRAAIAVGLAPTTSVRLEPISSKGTVSGRVDAGDDDHLFSLSPSDPLLEAEGDHLAGCPASGRRWYWPRDVEAFACTCGRDEAERAVPASAAQAES